MHLVKELNALLNQPHVRLVTLLCQHDDVSGLDKCPLENNQNEAGVTKLLGGQRIQKPEKYSFIISGGKIKSTKKGFNKK